MRRKQTLIRIGLAGGVVGLATAAAFANYSSGTVSGYESVSYPGTPGESLAASLPESIELTGIVRDFKASHPDFETFNTGVKTQMVARELGADGKPVVNPDRIHLINSNNLPTSSTASFAQWFRDVPGVNISFPHTISLTRQDDGKYVYARQGSNMFFPADYQGFEADGAGMIQTRNGFHNYHFTYELETQFAYTAREDRDSDLVFRFVGDDDVWVYINGKLAVDLGGVHGQASGEVNLDQKAQELGLEPGNVYSLKLFFAERHTTASNFRIETTMQLRRVELPPTPGLYD